MGILSSDEKRALLAGVPLFKGLGSRELEALVPVTRVETLATRQEIFHKGDTGARLYVVVSGRVKALTTSLEGDDVVFNIMGEGEVFGEVALLSSSHRTATIKALEACELLSLDRRDFLTFLRSHPGVSAKLLEVLADRLKRISEFVEDTHFLNLPVRLAKKFSTFASRYGEPAEGGTRINLKLSQEEWGDLVGATRESINKQMRTWGDEGLIRVDDGYVVLTRADELERLAGFMVT